MAVQGQPVFGIVAPTMAQVEPQAAPAPAA